MLILSDRHQRPAARGLEDIVVYNYQEATKSPLKPFMQKRFRETFALQEEAKMRNEVKAHQILQRVGKLEMASWNKADAVEDMGTT